MSFHVAITAAAKSNLHDAHDWVAQFAPETAAPWLNRLEAEINSLAEFPRRCPLARENQLVEAEIREMLFGKRSSAFRVLFTIDGGEVRILHVRRASRDWATVDDLT